MGDLEQQWQELVDAGECDQDFEDWYSSLCADAYDKAKAGWQD